jgi:multiple sugar transport system substrate-binding protein
MKHLSRWFGLFLVLVTIVGTVGVAFAADPTATPVPIPAGVKVAGMPEVLPTKDELTAAIWPGLKDPANKGKTLRVMFQGGGDSAPLMEQKDFFKAATGIDLQIDVIPPESLHEKQLAAFTSGAGDYDVMELYPTWIGEYSEAGYIENLDPYYDKYKDLIKADDFLTGVQVGYDKYAGKWYATPFDGDVNIFYYRKDLVSDPKNQADFKAKFGYDLKAPDTWDEVLAQAEFFNQPPKMYGFGTLALRTWWAADYWANLYRPMMKNQQAQNGLVNDKGEFELEKDAFIAANDLYIKLMKFSPEGILNWGYPETKEGLGNGTVAQSMQWATGVFRDPRQASMWDKLGFAPMPGVKGADGKIIRKPALAVGKAMVLPVDGKNKDLAFQLAMFLATPAMQIYETNTGSGVDPNRKSVYADPRVSDVWDGIKDAAMADMEIGVPDIKVPLASKYYDALVGELHGSWAGQQTSAQAYDKVMKAWDTIKKEG